jgi:putative tryptophan/tyrosine transport system substrate-binding protein
MKRREFIAGLGSAAAWPVVGRAQQRERIRRIGVLMGRNESDPQAKASLSAFTQELAELGWTSGRNVQMELRWAPGDLERMQMSAKELVDLQPDLILANTTPVTAALRRETQTIPIIFAAASDPVGSGFVASLSHPGGNITGFINLEGTLGGKWLQLLKEIAPEVKRSAAMFNPDTAPYIPSYYMPQFEAAARSLRVMPITAPVRSDDEIASVIVSLAREPGGGLVAMTDGFMQIRRPTIISLAAKHKIPAVYEIAVSVREGGLLSYGADFTDIFRRAAVYADRILRGAKPTNFRYRCRSNLGWR